MVNLLTTSNLLWWYVKLFLSLKFYMWKYQKLIFGWAGRWPNCGKFNKKSGWNDCTMWWICCGKEKMGRSSSCPSLGPRTWSWLRFYPWWYNENFISGFIPLTSNGWWSNKGISFLLKFWCGNNLLLLLPHLVICIFPNSCCKGSFLIAEVMAAKGYKVQPLCRIKRHDTVQVCLSHLALVKAYTNPCLLTVEECPSVCKKILKCTIHHSITLPHSMSIVTICVSSMN